MFIIFFVTIVEVPALVLLGFWFLEQLLLRRRRPRDPLGGGEGVAYFAHIGGFVFGLRSRSALFAQARPPRGGRPAAGLA